MAVGELQPKMNRNSFKFDHWFAATQSGNIEIIKFIIQRNSCSSFILKWEYSAELLDILTSTRQGIRYVYEPGTELFLRTAKQKQALLFLHYQGHNLPSDFVRVIYGIFPQGKELFNYHA